jgi:hypothetical protein
MVIEHSNKSTTHDRARQSAKHERCLRAHVAAAADRGGGCRVPASRPRAGRPFHQTHHHVVTIRPIWARRPRSVGSF